ncbi:MAG: hypothetical protein AB7O92_11115 [Acidimicrobiia bacterium]
MNKRQLASALLAAALAVWAAGPLAGDRAAANGAPRRDGAPGCALPIDPAARQQVVLGVVDPPIPLNSALIVDDCAAPGADNDPFAALTAGWHGCSLPLDPTARAFILLGVIEPPSALNGVVLIDDCAGQTPSVADVHHG